MKRYTRTRVTISVLSLLLGVIACASILGIDSRATAQGTVQRAIEIPIPPGVKSSHPAVVNGPDLTFVGASASPKISSLDAQDAIANLGIPWALGGNFMGKPGQAVTISATYGLATFGHPGDNSSHLTPDGKPLMGGCVGWFGPCNVPVYKCMQIAQCGNDGTTIPRVERRSIWLVDIGGATFVGGRVSYNHSVYAVDEETKSVLFIWGYDGL